VIPKINKILYATDLSQNSAYALRYAINSAMAHDTQIILLHVLNQIPENARAIEDQYFYSGEQDKNIQDYLTDVEEQKKIYKERIHHTVEQIRKRIEIICEREIKDNPECKERVASIEICEGYPPEEILKKAEEFDCDAIVIGTHGKGFLTNAFLGSTAKKILRRARKPVLIIPIPTGETDVTLHCGG